MRYRPIMAFALAVLGVLVACSKKAGDQCEGNEELCLDKKTVLSCHDSKLKEIPCSGPDGCDERTWPLCDLGGAKDGDVCTSAQQGSVRCSTDSTTLIRCADGRFNHIPCRGDKKCRLLKAAKIKCDATKARLEERCDTRSGVSCSEDGKQRLVCKAQSGTLGAWTLDFPCRGPKGCYQQGNTLSCDRTVASVGDRCVYDGVRCSPDGKRLLICNGLQFRMHQHCRGPKGCTMAGEAKVSCDQSIAVEGDPCKAKSAACSKDGKHALVCKKGKMAKKRCFFGCRVEPDGVDCR